MLTPKNLSPAVYILVLSNFLVTSTCGAAEASQPQQEGLCKPIPPLITLPVKKTALEKAPTRNIQVQADRAVSRAEQVTHFSGDVLIEQQNKRLACDEADYDHKTEILNARGNVRYDDGKLQFSGRHARLQMSKDQGQIDDVTYRMLAAHISGQAKSLHRDSANQLHLKNATYTTCDLDNIDWILSASEINLDNKSHQGTAKNVVIKFQHVPFLYLPYLRFPIGDQRLSGFLFPDFANTDRSGVEISLPYYWNIAPNRDATITPIFLKKRGTKLNTEFRYLNARNQGTIEIDYLSNDREANGLNRQYYHWVHQATPLAGWNASLDYQRVGDVKYFEDFGGGLNSTSLTSLERHANLVYNQPDWNVSLLAQDYQILSGGTQYQRLPQLRLQTTLPEEDNHLNYALNAEWTRFDNSNPARVRGNRFEAMPSITFPWQNEAMFLIPKLSLKVMQYQLDQAYNGSKKYNLAQPVFSLDSGIFLERDTSLAGIPLLHTLEPRLFYLYAPYRDQSRLPVFDTAIPTASLANLFSENRFSGLDRYGDANQISASLTTRLLRTDSGAELFNASVGQIFYLDDRRVGLGGNILDTRKRSSLFAELHLRPDARWQFDSEWQQDSDTQQTQVATNQLQYRLDRDKIARLAYRFSRNALDTREAAFFWRLNPHWQFFANDKFDLKEDHTLERFSGFQYDSCCWAFRVMLRKNFRGLLNGRPDFENGIYFELVLKGLSSFGRRKDIESFLATTGLN